MRTVAQIDIIVAGLGRLIVVTRGVVLFVTSNSMVSVFRTNLRIVQAIARL